MPMPTSYRALCQALLLIAAITFQCIPLPGTTIVFARVKNGGQRKVPGSNQSKATARPQRTPGPNGLSAVNITATLRDAFPNHGDGMAHAGDVITYTVTIANSGDTDATGVVFDDIVDINTSTLVPSSADISPIILSDSYAALGNVRLNTATIAGPTADVRNNDVLNGGALSGFGATQASANGTAIGGTVTTTNGSTVVLNADGTFTFNPAAGFTGTDSFFYTATNSVGAGTGKVSVNVSNRIWFVDAAAAPGGDGRLTSPFNCLVGAGCFDPVANDAPGEIIFLYSGNYSGGLTLLNNQFLIGQAASNSIAAITGLTPPTGSDPLPGTAGGPVTITTVTPATNGINVDIGANATIRGLTVSNTTGTKIASGTSFGTLTLGNNSVPDVDLQGNGAALGLMNGTFGPTSGLSSLSTTSSASQGVALVGVAGSIIIGGTAISGNTTQCILVSGSTVTMNFGNTSCSGGTDGVSLQNNSSGIRFFGSLTVSGGSGNAFLHAVGGGNTTITGAANLSSGINPIEIQNAGASNIIFGNTSATRTGSGGIGVNLTSNTGATITFNSLAIVTSSGTGLNATGGGTINVTNPTGAINTIAQPAPAIIANGVTLNANFSSTSSSGGTNGVSLTNVTGTLNLGSGSITGSTSTAFNVNGGNPIVNYIGGITQNNAQRVVDIQNTSGGSITLNSITGGSSSTGVNINAANGNVSFANLNHGTNVSRATNQAVTITGGTGTYALGTVSIFTNNVRGIVATNADGSINSSGGTVDALTSTAIDIDGPAGLTTLGMSLTRVDSSGGSSNGIIIRDTNGSFTVVGAGTAGSGGTIANKTGANASTTQGSGVFLNNVTNISLARMQMNDFQNFAIRGTTVTGFTLDNCIINATGAGTNGDVQGEGGVGEGSIRFDNLLGTASILDSTITHGVYDNVGIFNTSGTLNRLTVSNTTFATTINSNTGNDAVRMEASNNGTVMNATFNNDCDFTAARGDLIDIIAQTGSTVDIDVIGNDFLNNHVSIASGGGGTIFHGGGTMTFNIVDNDMRDAVGRALNVSKSATAGTFSGFIDNNRIGVQGVDLSGSSQASGIFVDGGGAGSMTVSITNNTVREYNEAGIFLTANNQGIASNSATMHSTVTGNTTVPFSSGSTLAFAGIFADVGTGVSGDTTFGCMDIGGASQNDFSAGDPFDAGDINLSVQAGSTMRLPGYAGANNNNAQITAYLQGRNLNAATTKVSLSFAGTMTGGAACTQPAPSGPQPETTQKKAERPVVSRLVRSDYSGARIDSSVAIRNIIKLGEREMPVATTRETQVTDNARVELAMPVHEFYRPKAKQTHFHHAAKRVTKSAIQPFIPQGGGTVNLNVGTISAGSSVTITFQVTVNASAPLGVNQISNQGTVSGSNFSSVVTDDPDTPAPNDPTLTPLLHPTAAGGMITGRIVTEEGRPVEGVVVTLNGLQSRKTITDADGNYSFKAVETGGLYTVTPARANYNFNPFNRTFNQLTDRTEALFTGLFTTDSANPLDTAEYFIRQQYVDILGREPDEGGFNYWSNRILECGGELLCNNNRRREVAAAFFIEQEFQQTGSFIYDIYKSALGRQPAYIEYAADRRLVVAGTTLDLDKAAFATAFVQRAEFLQKYQSNTTAASFVDALLANVLQASGVNFNSQRDSLLTRYNSGQNQIESRSFVLRDVADSTALRQAEYNSAFVLTEYFGYLRRDPDPGGYLFWLDVLNNRVTGNYVGMVCAFITSTEYQRRFSGIVSRSNSDCNQ